MSDDAVFLWNAFGKVRAKPGPATGVLDVSDFACRPRPVRRSECQEAIDLAEFVELHIHPKG